MDLAQLKARLAELVATMRSLTTPPADAGDGWDMDDDAVTRFDEAETEAAELRTKISDAERRLRAIADSTAIIGGDDAPGNRGPFDAPSVNGLGDGYDLTTLRLDAGARDLRARAETALTDDKTVEDWVKTNALATLRSVRDNGAVARLFLATGSEAYRTAFAKLASGAHWALDDAERQAVARAQSLTGNQGGFAVPFTLDPTVILTNNSAINPMRRISRVVQTSTTQWAGVTSAGATASWDVEASEVSDDAVTLAQPNIPVHKMQVFVPFSVEIEGDWSAIQSDLRDAMVDARDRLEANAHIKGTGVNQPTGLQTTLVGGGSVVAPLVAETFAAGDVYNMQRLLPPRYRPSIDVPTWVGALGTAGRIRQFDTGGGGNFWAQIADGTPERLVGWRWEESSEVDDAVNINPAVTANNRILFVGDFSRYVIVDRVGMQIELIPHLLHVTTNRPSGQRGLIGWLRTGADSIDDNAFRMLDVATTL
jgi:HK97 family phage major capsid protein